MRNSAVGAIQLPARATLMFSGGGGWRGRVAVSMALLSEDLAAWGCQVHQTRFLKGGIHTLGKQCSYAVYEYSAGCLCQHNRGDSVSV
jgi:hypothetical protein